MENFVALSTLTMLCNYHLCRAPKHFHHTRMKSSPNQQSLSIPPPPEPGSHWSAFCSYGSACRGHFLWMESCAVWLLASVFSPTASCFEVHPHCRMNQCLAAFNGWVQFHCTDAPVFCVIHSAMFFVCFGGSMQDFSSPTRDWIHAPCGGSSGIMESWLLDCQGSKSLLVDEWLLLSNIL